MKEELEDHMADIKTMANKIRGKLVKGIQIIILFTFIFNILFISDITIQDNNITIHKIELLIAFLQLFILMNVARLLWERQGQFQLPLKRFAKSSSISLYQLSELVNE